jgi:hypothetical protein
METEVDENGEYIPCIVKENESGFYRTDWHWGKDIELARECAKQKNEALELSEKDVEQIIMSSMFNVVSDKAFQD